MEGPSTNFVLAELRKLKAKQEEMEMGFDAKLRLAADESYAKGRADAVSMEAQWLKSAPPVLVEKAKKLVYISLADLRKARLVAPMNKKKSCSIGTTENESVRLYFDEDCIEQEGAIRWPDWIEDLLELVHLYRGPGAHSVKMDPVFWPYLRILLRFGNTQKFTYESIYRLDFNIRSRESGQGINLSWTIDINTVLTVVYYVYVARIHTDHRQTDCSRFHQNAARHCGIDPHYGYLTTFPFSVRG